MAAHQKNEEVIRELFRSFNQDDPERGAVLMAEAAELIDVPFGEVLRGRDGWHKYVAQWRSAFPDGKTEITNLVAHDRFVAVEYTGRGTHTGVFHGPSGEVAPTGRTVELQLCDVCELEDGKVIRVRSYFDSASLMRQMGMAPERAAAGA